MCACTRVRSCECQYTWQSSCGGHRITSSLSTLFCSPVWSRPAGRELQGVSCFCLPSHTGTLESWTALLHLPTAREGCNSAPHSRDISATLILFYFPKTGPSHEA